MADTLTSNSTQSAEPPNRGRQDHEVMRAAAMRPITGPGSTDTLASLGGLDVPGREPHPELAATSDGDVRNHDLHEMIPGERDATTLTHREPGAVGGQFAGADVPAPDPATWMDERTAFEHAREGGGGAIRKGTDVKHR